VVIEEKTMATVANAPARRPQESTPSRSERRAASRVNVGELERWISLVGGGVLAYAGLRRLSSVLGLGLAAGGVALLERGLSGHCLLYQELGLTTAKPRNPNVRIPASHGVKVEKSVTVNRPQTDVFRFWRNLENLPRFMKHVQSVRSSGEGISHWEARAPLGRTISWDAELFVERPNEVLSWRSLEGSDVATAGSVHFRPAPGGRGTEVRVVLKYDPPAGKVGATLARLFGEAPEQQIEEDLHRFKQLMEAGECPTIEGPSRGHC
jgi:uncharacterized membrane protein